MRVDELKLIPVWLSLQHLVSTAKYVMDGHKLKALGVVDDEKFVGIVRRERLSNGTGAELIAGVVEEPAATIDSSMRIEKAADLFIERELDFAPVLDGTRFLGILTPNILLRELKQSRDPLTGLPWSDRLREWGIDRLREGREITIVFFDLDDFGAYNKQFGHIVGDRVLQFFAEHLKSKVDPEREVLVRYGGDEFAICTCRSQQEVKDLLGEIGSSIGMEDSKPVRFSVGTSGGRRTAERENIHYAATIDNLINLASRDCLHNKHARVAAVVVPEREPAPFPRAESTITVEFVHDAKTSYGSLTTVILSTRDAVFSGIHTRTCETVHRSIALATCQALQKISPEHQLTIDEVYHLERTDGGRFVTVVGHLRSGDDEVAVSGDRIVVDDVNKAVAKATVAAFTTSVSAVI